MAFPTRLTKVGYSSEHFNERTGMCYHQTPPWERVVAYVGDARQAKPHLEHNPLSLLGVRHAIPMRKLNDPVYTPSGKSPLLSNAESGIGFHTSGTSVQPHAWYAPAL